MPTYSSSTRAFIVMGVVALYATIAVYAVAAKHLVAKVPTTPSYAVISPNELLREDVARIIASSPLFGERTLPSRADLIIRPEVRLVSTPQGYRASLTVSFAINGEEIGVWKRKSFRGFVGETGNVERTTRLFADEEAPLSEFAEKLKF